MSNVANPVAATAIGVLLLGERVGTDGAGVVLALLAAAVTAVGVHLLSSVRREPRTAPQADRLPGVPSEFTALQTDLPALVGTSGR